MTAATAEYDTTAAEAGIEQLLNQAEERVQRAWAEYEAARAVSRRLRSALKVLRGDTPTPKTRSVGREGRVREAAMGIDGDFTLTTLRARLNPEDASAPATALTPILHRLVQAGRLEVVNHGRGAGPNTYRRTGGPR
jgi:hypothetical protein